MNKEDFNRLSIGEKVECVNNSIEKSGSASNFLKSIGINVETFRNNIRNLYTYVPYLRRYVKISELENYLSKDRVQEDNSLDGLIVVGNSKSEKSTSTGLIEIDKPQEKLFNILSNYDKIMNLIENASQHPQSALANGNFMDLNMPSSNLKKTTIRVNEDIWNDFKKLIDTEYSHLEQFDMISVAFRDFVNKYSSSDK